jgi:hypothetical protein
MLTALIPVSAARLLAAGHVSGRVTWAALVAGLVVVTMGLLFRFGRLRGMGRYYDNAIFPTWTRNVGLGMIPIGLVFLCWSVTGFLAESAPGVAEAAALASLLLMAVSMWVTYRPPAWIKPAWMRKGERWDARRPLT